MGKHARAAVEYRVEAVGRPLWRLFFLWLVDPIVSLISWGAFRNLTSGRQYIAEPVLSFRRFACGFRHLAGVCWKGAELVDSTARPSNNIEHLHIHLCIERGGAFVLEVGCCSMWGGRG